MNFSPDSDSDSISVSVRRRAFSAAVWALFRRPLIWLVFAAFVVQVGLLVVALQEGHRTSDSDSNIPSYESNGERLWDIGGDIRAAYDAGVVNSSIENLHLDSLPIEETAGQTVVRLRDDSPRSEGDESHFLEISIAQFADFLKYFPHVQHVSLRSDQLAALPAELFNEMPELRAVRFETDELTEAHLKGLSRLRKIEHLTVEAAWCEHGMSQLAALPNLKSLHLKSSLPERNRYQTDVTTPLFMSIPNIASVMNLPKLEELAIEEDGDLLNYVFTTGLTSDSRDQYDQFVKTIKLSPTLQTVYVGYLRSPRSSDLFEQMESELPGLAIRPARFNSAMGEWAMLGNLATCFGLVMLNVHLVTCIGGAQNCLLNGARTSHMKVFLTGAAVFLLVSIVTGLVHTHANWLAVITFESSLFAVSTVFAMMRGGVPQKLDNTASLMRKLAPLALFPVAALSLFVWIGWKVFGIHVASFFCGQFSVVCLIVLASACVLITTNLRYYLNLYRVMAENGITPATTWAEYQQAAATQYEMLQQQVADQAGEKSVDAVVKEDAWIEGLKSLVAQLRQQPQSAILRCRLWLAATIPFRISRWLFVFFPLYMMWPMYWEFLTTERGLSVFANPIWLCMIMGSVIFFYFLMVVSHWHVRRPMFEMEILRPVTRRTWRNTALLTLLFATSVITLYAWALVSVLRLIGGQPASLGWLALSLASVFASTILATGLNLWALVQSHVVAVAVLFLAALAAFAPLMFTSIPSDAISPNSSLHFSIWTMVVMAELFFGSLILKTAWSKWGRLELAN